MRNQFTKRPLCLTLFDGAGAASAGAAAPVAAGSGAQAGAQAGAQVTPERSRRGKKSGGEPKVVYGKQPQRAEAPPDGAEEGRAAGGKQAETLVSSNTAEARRAQFRALVDGEYKDLYTEETQAIIDRRFRQTKTLEEQLAAREPILEALMTRYQIADGDVGKLSKAIEQDDAYWTGAAEEAGLTVEQYKDFTRLQRENAALKKTAEDSVRQSQQSQQLQKWYGEAETMQGSYPNFDLAGECKDPQFLSMLRSGVPMEHAYKVMHLDEITTDAARTAAEAAEKNVMDSVRARGSRPSENGTAAQSGFIIKSDVSKLTRADRAEIAKRVARGETVSF